MAGFDRWLRAEVDLDDSVVTILFRALRGQSTLADSGLGDIAIDDIAVFSALANRAINFLLLKLPHFC